MILTLLVENPLSKGRSDNRTHQPFKSIKPYRRSGNLKRDRAPAKRSLKQRPWESNKHGGREEAHSIGLGEAPEKALKGFLYSRGYRALITHSVVELLEESSRLSMDFKRFGEEGVELDRHYIGSRYPNFYPKGPAYRYYTRSVAERCASYAESILREVEKSIRG
jgi:HEPN domain-containing protein